MSYHRYNASLLRYNEQSTINHSDGWEVFKMHMRQSFLWGATLGVIICTVVLASC